MIVSHRHPTCPRWPFKPTTVTLPCGFPPIFVRGTCSSRPKIGTERNASPHVDRFGKFASDISPPRAREAYGTLHSLSHISIMFSVAIPGPGIYVKEGKANNSFVLLAGFAQLPSYASKDIPPALATLGHQTNQITVRTIRSRSEKRSGGLAALTKSTLGPEAEHPSIYRGADL